MLALELIIRAITTFTEMLSFTKQCFEKATPMFNSMHQWFHLPQEKHEPVSTWMVRINDLRIKFKIDNITGDNWKIDCIHSALAPSEVKDIKTYLETWITF